MPNLVSPNNTILTLPIGSTVIGRDAVQCQIVLDHPFISRLQAVIEVRDDGIIAIKNLSSRQTTFVNGQAIDVCALNDGDKLEMGAGQTLTFTFHNADLEAIL